PVAATERGAQRNPDWPFRSFQNPGRTVSVGSVVRPHGAAGRTCTRSRPQWQNQILPRASCAAISFLAWGKARLANFPPALVGPSYSDLDEGNRCFSAGAH